MVVTDWPVALTVDTAGWPPGFYVFRLDAQSGGQRYVPLAVRWPSAAGKLVIVNGDSTWQAYNTYGGYSLYQGPDGAAGDRARAVSFDRPYGCAKCEGAGEFQENLLPLVSLVERLGLPADYLSDVDLHAVPHVLDGARAVLTPGHDEYYSTLMRAALTHARDAGVNLAFFGANAIYRHVRFASSPEGVGRIEICYKDPPEDPLYGHNDAEVTGQWRYPPDPRPESVLTGVFYESNPVRADMVITDPSNWLFRDARVNFGMHLPGLVGGEYDRVNPAVPTPRPIEVLAHSPLICRGQPSYSDMAYYSTVSGAGVFATGTNSWVNALAGAWGPVSQRVTTGVTARLLRVFAQGPAGKTHGAHDNLVAVHPFAGNAVQ